MRRGTREIDIGGVKIGGEHPVAIQSMTNTDTKDVEATAAQIARLAAAGCEIVRCAVYDAECAVALRDLKKSSVLPIVADIHIDYRLAIASIENGADKIRINPGNIGTPDKVKRVVDAAMANGVPMRIGVNSGSIEREFDGRFYEDAADALVGSTLKYVHMIEDMGYDRLVLSPKSSDAVTTIAAYRKLSAAVDYPLHLGVTEAGRYESSVVKTAVALGGLIADGIGDTIRVSITGDPVDEIRAAKEILRFSGARSFGPVVVSCPTCARTKIDVEALAREVERRVAGMDRDITIAVMGCVINGPGEAKHADIGIAGGDGRCTVFAQGKYVRSVDEKDAVEALLSCLD